MLPQLFKDHFSKQSTSTSSTSSDQVNTKQVSFEFELDSIFLELIQLKAFTVDLDKLPGVLFRFSFKSSSQCINY